MGLIIKFRNTNTKISLTSDLKNVMDQIIINLLKQIYKEALNICKANDS